jgi:F0F1-type ATP synthase assembly protein I
MEEKMENKEKKHDISSWAVGGGLMMGIGAGFFFLKTNPLYFVGCILLGLGLGLIIAPIISKSKE